MVKLPDEAEKAIAKPKAIYIYNFTKYIEWPAESKQGNFVVGILGISPIMISELSKAVEKNNSKPESRKIEIINLSSADDVTKCHIVYILPDNSAQLADVVNKIKSKSTLIVTEKPGMTKQGAGINFVIKDDKLQFELNKPTIENHNMKVASGLEALAVH